MAFSLQKSFLPLAIGLSLGAISGTASQAAQFPACNAVPVEKRIIREFNRAEAKTWKRGITLIRLDRMHEHRTVNRANSEVTRRYCNGTAVLADGRRRQIWYLIEDIGGFVGKNWSVTHCVSGLDPWKNHDGACRTLR